MLFRAANLLEQQAFNMVLHLDFLQGIDATMELIVKLDILDEIKNSTFAS